MEPITGELVKKLLPPRAGDAHKGDFGRVLVISGSVGFSGAAWFCGMAAVRSGAGLVAMGVPERIWDQVASGARECMCYPLPCDEQGRIDKRSFAWIGEQLEKADVCACGPGLGRSADIETLISMLMEHNTPLVLDADGINNKRGHILNCSLVLTPHEGEFVRMGGLLDKGRVAGGRAYIEHNPCVLVLKGRETLIFEQGREIRVNTTGGPGLAKGGSGDVLTGIIAAFIAQGLSPYDAASAGVFIHGLAGDICTREIGERGMTPSDVVIALPRAIKETTGR